jgi:cell shape-determining protein MreC
MHAEIDHQFKNIQTKLQQLLKQYQLLQKENEQLKNELEENKLQSEATNTIAQNLQQKIDVAGLVTQQNSGAEKAALQKRIDKYLQEIDKCLLLLNASV